MAECKHGGRALVHRTSRGLCPQCHPDPARELWALHDEFDADAKTSDDFYAYCETARDLLSATLNRLGIERPKAQEESAQPTTGRKEDA